MDIIKELLNANKDILTDDEIKDYLKYREHDEKEDLLVECKEYNFYNIHYLILEIDEILNMLSKNNVCEAYEELVTLKKHYIDELMDLEYEE